MRRQKTALGFITLTIPRGRRAENLIGRLQTLAEKRDRPLNYLVVEAILEYIRREESRLPAAGPLLARPPLTPEARLRTTLHVLPADSQSG